MSWLSICEITLRRGRTVESYIRDRDPVRYRESRIPRLTSGMRIVSLPTTPILARFVMLQAGEIL